MRVQWCSARMCLEMCSERPLTTWKMPSFGIPVLGAKSWRMGALSRAEFDLLRSRFHADLRVRKFRIIPVQAPHFQRAADLLATHAPTQNLRTLDALQLAVALDLHRHSPLDAFVCADTALCDAAQQEGLSVVNPPPV